LLILIAPINYFLQQFLVRKPIAYIRILPKANEFVFAFVLVKVQRNY